MGDYNIIRARYNNISELMAQLDKPNNSIMKDEHSSNSGSSSFTMTKNYREAVDLLYRGYSEPIKQIIEDVNKNRKTIEHFVQPARKLQNMPIGYLPNVPNAILGLPDSMINITMNAKKTRTLRVAYASSAACTVSAQDLAKAGSRLVSALNIIELNGIQTELNIDFFCGQEGKELTSAMLKIKGFGERFNVSKICFPMVHPSMFRRIGFKFLETTEGLTSRGWTCGYGRRPTIETINTCGLYEPGIKPITFDQINTAFKYDIKKIVDYLTDANPDH